MAKKRKGLYDIIQYPPQFPLRPRRNLTKRHVIRVEMVYELSVLRHLRLEPEFVDQINQAKQDGLFGEKKGGKNPS